VYDNTTKVRQKYRCIDLGKLEEREKDRGDRGNSLRQGYIMG
jgi:hypothetical protein